MAAFAAVACAADSPGFRVNGRVTSETKSPVAGAQVTAVELSGALREAVTDPTGAFSLLLPAPGVYEIRVDRAGFFVHNQRGVQAAADGVLEIEIALRTIHEAQTSVEVAGTAGVADMDRTTPQTTLSSRTLFDVPFPNQNSLRSGLRMMPGVVQDSRGGLHLFGGAEDQAQYSFEGFQLNDPLSGRFDARMSLEAIESVDVSAGRSGAEFGRGAAGSMEIQARRGGDKFRFGATNVFPGIDAQRGVTVGSWTPRGSISGPWKRGKAWFFNTSELQYINTFVPELPRGQDKTHSWRASNLLHNQINLTQSNIATVGLLVNYFYAPRSGLTYLDPRLTTVDRRSHQWFGYFKDQQSFARGALLEIGYAASRTFTRDSPQGNQPYIITPFGRRGNSFARGSRDAARDQVLLNSYLPSFTFLGTHQIKAGADALRLDYSQRVSRSGILYSDASGVTLRRVEFAGPGHLDKTNIVSSLYLQDSWRLRPRLLLETGLRGDRDELLGNTNFSPRFGFAWSPQRFERTRFSGGVARMFDATNLRLFTRSLDQFAVSTYYDETGALLHGPALSLYRGPSGHVPSPRSLNWNLAVEQQLPYLLQAKAQYLRRRGADGFSFLNSLNRPEYLDAPVAPLPFLNPVVDALYVLSSRRRDEYDSFEVSLRQPLKRQYEWVVSFMHSRARSNTVLERSIDEPLDITSNTGALPWDTPNRLVSWGYLPTGLKKWSFAYLYEWRTGFPFAVQDVRGHILGRIDDHRFPQFLELNLFVERQLELFGYRMALRGGFNNLTNHKNPNVADNVFGGTSFLRVYGGQSRALNFRIRWLGKL